MKIKDLKSGDIVELRSGITYLDISEKTIERMKSEYWDDVLEHKEDSNKDIVSVTRDGFYIVNKKA